ncbi:hypothetical protein A7A08_03110 [Methyloligella halotolerans]|uniref:DUF805 domain-containing protein n=1 Tax=Methyloligella halotolerans TaxID=1177755 RepID=A0A1E2RUN8_9HYPH|nr:DUF805 domain-containing protein [Methyloligella halotolerans]ODA65967.1 hypothetical protein A7A08_03110 [Methyloligella halotolerans]
MDLKHLYLTLRGRIGRQTFWMAMIPLFVAYWVASILIHVMAASMAGNQVMGALASGMIMVVSAAFLIGFIAVCVKRLHDRGKSGWWMAGLYAVSLAGIFVATSSGLAMTPVGFTSLGNMLTALWLGILLWLIIELGIMRGTRGSNAYGPDPLEATEGNTAS